MRMPRVLRVAAVACLLVTAGCSNSADVPAASEDDLSPNPTVTVFVTTTPTPAATDAVSESVAPGSPSPVATAKPRGALSILGGPQAKPGGSFYGRQSSTGRCSTYRIALQNNSNTEVVSVTLRAQTSYYFDTEQDAKVRPVSLGVSLPAHTRQDALYTMCATVPSRTKDDFIFAILGPTQSFEWVTGDEGTAQYVEIR